MEKKKPEDLADRYAHRFMEAYPNEIVNLIKEAYMTAYSYGRNLTDLEILDQMVRLRKDDFRDRLIKTVALAVFCLWCGVKMGAQ